MPVSKRRKPKKNKSRSDKQRNDGRIGPAGTRRAPWFSAATAGVLASGDEILAAGDVVTLERTVTGLVGGVLADHFAGPDGTYAEEWLSELTRRAARRAAGPADAEAARALRRLLLVLAGTTTDADHDTARAGLAALDAAGLPTEPLAAVSEPSATGETWTAQDRYGDRVGFFARFAYPDTVETAVLLVDWECSWGHTLDAGVFTGLDEAAAHWRAAVGASADGIEPVAVTDPGELHVLTALDRFWHGAFGRPLFVGHEERGAIGHAHLVHRRLHDLLDHLEDRGTTLPERTNPAHRAVSLTDEFLTWYTARTGETPDRRHVEYLADDWLISALPGTEHAASPAKVRGQVAYMNDDWLPDAPETRTVRRLYADWVRWCLEVRDVPGELAAPSIEIAEKAFAGPAE